MNCRAYRPDKVVFGQNAHGPVSWGVPVLRVNGINGTARAIHFGYACHSTCIAVTIGPWFLTIAWPMRAKASERTSRAR